MPGLERINIECMQSLWKIGESGCRENFATLTRYYAYSVKMGIKCMKNSLGTVKMGIICMTDSQDTISKYGKCKEDILADL